MLPFCCHRGLSNGEKPLFAGFFTGANLFPLNSSRRLGGNVVDDAVDAFDLVDYAGGAPFEDIVGDSGEVGGHEVGGGDGTESEGVVIGSAVAHDADRAH